MGMLFILENFRVSYRQTMGIQHPYKRAARIRSNHMRCGTTAPDVARDQSVGAIAGDRHGAQPAVDPSRALPEPHLPIVAHDDVHPPRRSESWS